MQYTVSLMGYELVREHTCTTAQEAVGPLLDVRQPMLNMIDGMALSDLALPAQRIWAEVRQHFYTNDNENVIQGLSEQQVVSRVYRLRRSSYGGDVHGMVEIPPMSLVGGTEMSFFQFHVITPNETATGPPDRILGWAHPVLIDRLRYHNLSLFIDGTFRCVPRQFAQCVVLMVHDRASGLYVPVFYALTSRRTEDMYWDLLHQIIQTTDQQLSPAEVICDFETGLINAISTQFPNAEVIGCMFHFKQALQKRLKKLRIPKAEIAIAMTKGVVDMLTVIDPERIESHGITWVKREIKARCTSVDLRYSRLKWREFWVYFRRTWISKYPPSLWNVFGLDNQLVARTNNPLERFNRELNTVISTPHPSVPVFVAKINALSRNYVDRLEGIPRSRSRRIPRETIQLPTPVTFTDEPLDYTSGEEEDDADVTEHGDENEDDPDEGDIDMSFDYESQEASEDYEYESEEEIIDV